MAITDNNHIEDLGIELDLSSLGLQEKKQIPIVQEVVAQETVFILADVDPDFEVQAEKILKDEESERAKLLGVQQVDLSLQATHLSIQQELRIIDEQERIKQETISRAKKEETNIQNREKVIKEVPNIPPNSLENTQNSGVKKDIPVTGEALLRKIDEAEFAFVIRYDSNGAPINDRRKELVRRIEPERRRLILEEEMRNKNLQANEKGNGN